MMTKEICIRCGKETEYDVSTPITIRRFFIEGSGQLCEECWHSVFNKTDGPQLDPQPSVQQDAEKKESLLSWDFRLKGLPEGIKIGWSES